VKILILQLTVVALCLAGCAATNYPAGQSGRVTFYLRAPGARGVAFASSLDDYQIHRAEQVNGSRWMVTVAANSEFRYFYIVDGRVYLPECALYEKDDFGSRNCIYVPGM
jgi:hypothetical protein